MNDQTARRTYKENNRSRTSSSSHYLADSTLNFHEYTKNNCYKVHKGNTMRIYKENGRTFNLCKALPFSDNKCGLEHTLRPRVLMFTTLPGGHSKGTSSDFCSPIEGSGWGVGQAESLPPLPKAAED